MDDCRACGACCFSGSTHYVPLTVRDESRLRARPDLVTRADGRAYLRMANDRCAALVRTAFGWRCSAYAIRPKACRAFERGSPACLAERSEKLLMARRAASGLSVL